MFRYRVVQFLIIIMHIHIHLVHESFCVFGGGGCNRIVGEYDHQNVDVFNGFGVTNPLSSFT